MKPYINALISPSQSAFIPGRLIQDNLFVAHEVFHRLKKKKRSNSYDMAIKVDMSKAYDRVEWDFLEAMLRKLGFSNHWVTLLMQCVSTVSYSISFNGDNLPTFQPKRGLRQGDPLSPYLFIIITEALNSLICHALTEGTLEGVKLSRQCPTLTHLLFADDSLFFAKATDSNAAALLEILNRYSYASGQLINLNKSGVFFSSNTPFNVRRNIADQLNMNLLSQMGKYLGIEAQWGRSKTQVLSSIVDKTLNKITGWKEKLLNLAGKEVLIKAVLQAIPYYYMSIFKFPKSTCNTINSKIAKFWWSKNSGADSIHWINWQKISSCKSEGGIGFKDFSHMNLALLAKQVWRLLMNQDSLCFKVLKAIYFPSTDIWDATAKPNSSWCWKSLMEGKNLLTQGARWSIGDGCSVGIWDKKWIPAVELPEPPLQTTVQLVSDLIHEGNWNRAVIESNFPPHIVSAILAIPLPTTRRKDRVIWPFCTNGEFSVKSGYRFIHSTVSSPRAPAVAPSTAEPLDWNLIWKASACPKVVSFLWKAIHNAIPCADNLFRRKLRTDNVCSICNQAPETVEHVLLLCPWTRCVWFGSPLQITPSVNGLTTFGNWIFNLLQKFKPLDNAESLISITFYLCWQLWLARNDFLFNKIAINPTKVIKAATSLSMEFLTAREKKIEGVTANLKVTLPSKTWVAPPIDVVKINSDASFLPNSLKACSGIIARNHYGQLIGGAASPFCSSSSIIAEALALKEAVSLAILHNYPKVIFESDSKNLIQSVNTPLSYVCWEISHIVDDIRNMARNLISPSFTFAPRSANGAANWVAQAKRRDLLPVSWIECNPPPLADLMAIDFPVSGIG